MTIQELEQQLLSLDQGERLRIVQLLTQSLAVPATAPPTLANPEPESFNFTQDRSPDHPLRRLPFTIPPDFDEPMTDLWDALEQ